MSMRCTRALTVALVLLAVGGIAAGGRADAPPEVGQVVGDFTLPDLEGRQHSLLDRRGAGPVVLVFFRGAW